MASTGWTNPTEVDEVDLEGGASWSDLSNALSEDGFGASVKTLEEDSLALYVKNFGFNIPEGSVINGIAARVKRRSSYSNASTDVLVALCYIYDEELALSSDKAIATKYPTTYTFQEYGDDSDDWNLPEEGIARINEEDFGVVFACNGGSCLAVGTKVLTDSGEKLIEELKVGDSIIGYDEEFKTGSYKVQHVRKERVDYHLIIRTASGNEIQASAVHPFRVSEYNRRCLKEITAEIHDVNEIWKLADDLEVGDQVYIYKDGKFVLDTITEISPGKGIVHVVSIKVDTVRTFIANGFAVHNKSDATVYVDVIQLNVYYTPPPSGAPKTFYNIKPAYAVRPAFHSIRSPLAGFI